MTLENLLTPEELAAANRTDDEIENAEASASEDTDAVEAKADDASSDADTKDDDKTEAKASEAGAAGEEATDEDDDRPALEPTFAPTFNAGDPAAIDGQLKAVRDELAALKSKWRSGDIDDDEFDRGEALLDERKDTLIQQRAQAVTAAEMNQASAVQAFSRDKTNFLSTMTKYEGVPYAANPMLADSFERELKNVAQAAIAEKRDPSAQELFEAAHAKVLEQLSALGVTFGKKKAEQKPDEQPAGKKVEARAPADRSQIPPTLGGMPSAAPNTTAESDLIAQAAQYEGEDLELFIAKLPAEKRRMLESAA